MSRNFLIFDGQHLDCDLAAAVLAATTRVRQREFGYRNHGEVERLGMAVFSVFIAGFRMGLASNAP